MDNRDNYVRTQKAFQKTRISFMHDMYIGGINEFYILNGEQKVHIATSYARTVYFRLNTL